MNLKKKKIITIIGARPQFIKHAPVELALKDDFTLLTIHTGQHYDQNMSAIFFDELGIQPPNYTLTTGGLSHAKQTGQMMVEIEEIILSEKPDGILVYGDTNSTLAGALVGSKLNIPVFHVEAGLRSYNKSMPEEINRIVTDHVSTLFFIPSDVAKNHLHSEGIVEHVYKVGDVMFDMIQLSIHQHLIKKTHLSDYFYCTLHRPYNVDEMQRLNYLLEQLEKMDKRVVFSRHPRTKQKMFDFKIQDKSYKNITFIQPVSYFENLGYIQNSSGLITDSGGMQKEAYWLRKQCVTIRTETEWTETLVNAWNTLLFDDLHSLNDIFKKSPGTYTESIYGDGGASHKIKEQLLLFYQRR